VAARQVGQRRNRRLQAGEAGLFFGGFQRNSGFDGGAEGGEPGGDEADGARGGGAGGRRVVQNVGQGDQAAKNLLAGLQPDGELGGAASDDAAAAEGVQGDAAGGLDGVADRAAVAGGVGFEGGRGFFGIGEAGEVFGEEGKFAGDIGEGAAGWLVGVDLPDDEGEQCRPAGAGGDVEPLPCCLGEGVRGVVECQDDDDGEEVADLQAALAVDAGVAGGENGEAGDGGGDEGAFGADEAGRGGGPGRRGRRSR
jgi:hypothetical protein